jgi:hypothetical protein
LCRFINNADTLDFEAISLARAAISSSSLSSSEALLSLNSSRLIDAVARWNLFHAARQSLMEYQFQLLHPLNKEGNDFESHITNDTIVINKATSNRVHTFKRLSSDVVAIVLDMRYRRLFHSQDRGMFDVVQLSEIEHQLQQWTNPTLTNEPIPRHILVIASSPLLYFSSFMSYVAEVADGDRTPTHYTHMNGTSELLRLLKPYWQLVTIVAGDIHLLAETVGCYSDTFTSLLPPTSTASLTTRRREGCLTQYITSGVSAQSTSVRDLGILLYSTYAYIHSGYYQDQWIIHFLFMDLGRNYGIIHINPSTGLSFTGVIEDCNDASQHGAIWSDWTAKQDQSYYAWLSRSFGYSSCQYYQLKQYVAYSICIVIEALVILILLFIISLMVKLAYCCLKCRR